LSDIVNEVALSKEINAHGDKRIVGRVLVSISGRKRMTGIP
jgi:hypothetical protein